MARHVTYSTLSSTTAQIYAGNRYCNANCGHVFTSDSLIYRLSISISFTFSKPPVSLQPNFLAQVEIALHLGERKGKVMKHGFHRTHRGCPSSGAMSNVLQSARPVPSPRTTSSPHPDSLLAAVSYSLLLLEAVCVDVSGGVYCKPTGLDWLCCSPGSCPKYWFPNYCESKAPMTVAQIAERVRNPVQGQVVNSRRDPVLRKSVCCRFAWPGRFRLFDAL